MTKEKDNTMFEKELEALPENIQKYIVSNRFQDDLDSLRKEFKLNEEQASLVEKELIFTLMGLEEFENLPKKLKPLIDKEEGLFGVSGRIIDLTSPFIEDVADIKIRHMKEVGKSSLKERAPTPPPKPAPLVYKGGENEAEGSKPKKAERSDFKNERADILKIIESSNDPSANE